MKHTLLAFLFSLAISPAWGDELAGTWKAAEAPAWVEINFAGDTGSGTVVRNDKFPERVGRQVLKGLVAGGKPGTWTGQIYAERLEEYKDAKISVDGEEMEIKVKVGFMSRTIEWQRVDALPQ
mgnify:FL=1